MENLSYLDSAVNETINKAVRNSKTCIIYRIHANIERQLRLPGKIGKNVSLPKHDDIKLNSMT